MLTPVTSPITDAERKLFGAYAVESEINGQLVPELLSMLHAKGWFKALIALNANDQPASLPELLALEEALAYIDGSIGWTVTLCSGAGWFAGFVADSIREQFFNGPAICIAGSGAIGGTAHTVEGGFIIRGYWKYATGAAHATAFTGNCTTDTGEVRSFLFLKEEIILHKTWNSMGMTATGSHSFSVEDLFVPESRAFQIAPEHATLPHPIYQYPFLQLADTTLSVNIAGMALRFLDLCKPVFFSEAFGLKNGSIRTSGIQAEWQSHLAEVEKRKDTFYSLTEASWKVCNQNMVQETSLLEQVSAASLALAKTSREAVTALFPYGGLLFTDKAQPINRVWRDIHTAGQHALLVR